MDMVDFCRLDHIYDNHVMQVCTAPYLCRGKQFVSIVTKVKNAWTTFAVTIQVAQ